MSASPNIGHENRLASATSPYLLQHKHNPVNWWQWGPEALAEAKRSNRPILLSVGYAACHWCHVMAHESFEDAETASRMNTLFVNVKVDREERPDIDHIYMAALHSMGQQGGWPLTMFLDPEGSPMFGGTYWPPEPRWWRAREDLSSRSIRLRCAATRRIRYCRACSAEAHFCALRCWRCSTGTPSPSAKTRDADDVQPPDRVISWPPHPSCS